MLVLVLVISLVPGLVLVQRQVFVQALVLAFFEENSILPLPERLESSGRQFLRVDVSQESPKHRGGGTASRETLGRIPEGPGGSPRDTPPSLSAKKVL